jgi:hypothetical protein
VYRSESVGGVILAGRLGIDVGGQTARGRLALDFTAAPGDGFERTYGDDANPVRSRFDWGRVTAIVIAFALQF